MKYTTIVSLKIANNSQLSFFLSPISPYQELYRPIIINLTRTEAYATYLTLRPLVAQLLISVEFRFLKYIPAQKQLIN